MLSFSLVAEALTGLIYHHPLGENSSFQSCMPYPEVKLDITLQYVVSLYVGYIVFSSVFSSGISLEIKITRALILPGNACISLGSQ